MRRKLAFALAVTLTCTSLVACGGSQQKTTEAPSSAASTTASDPTVSETTTADTGSTDMFVPETTTENQASILAEVTEGVSSAPKAFNEDNISERKLVFWDRMGEEHIMGQTEMAFYYALAELSGGKITADMYISGEIDVDSTNLPEAYSVFDVSRYQLELAAQNGYAKGAVFGLPYVIESREHFWNLAESELGQQIIDEINGGGFACHVLSYIEEGARNYFTTSAHPIQTYQDLAGLKLRVQSSDIYNGMVQAIGASPTTMAWSEVYTGLSSGVVDGAENPYTGYNAAMLFEVAPYMYEDEHIWGADLLTISTAIWDSLNEDEKEMFEEAAAIATAYNKKHIQQVEDKIKTKITSENGVTVITPTDEEKAALVEMCQPMYEQFAGDYIDYISEIKTLK